MHNLGHTRSDHRRDHLVQTPDTFVRSPLPGLERGVAVVHISRAAGAGFAQYTVELEAGGTLLPGALQRFIYVLAGEIEVSGLRTLTAGGYAYLPARTDTAITARAASRLAVIEKPYLSLEGIAAPGALTGHGAEAAATALNGDPDLQVRALLPDAPSFDFAVNIMTYSPGASLSQVEVHVMEHGLLMLEGGGIYRLSDAWYPVAAGDFIWMASFCPQWFGALGKQPAKYLIYKDWNRLPVE